MLDAAKTSCQNMVHPETFLSVNPPESFTQFTEVYAGTVLKFQKLGAYKPVFMMMVVMVTITVINCNLKFS